MGEKVSQAVTYVWIIQAKWLKTKRDEYEVEKKEMLLTAKRVYSDAKQKTKENA